MLMQHMPLVTKALGDIALEGKKDEGVEIEWNMEQMSSGGERSQLCNNASTNVSINSSDMKRNSL